MTTFTSPFTGDIVQPTDVSYRALEFSTNQVLAWPPYQSEVSGSVAVARIMDCTALAADLIIDLPPGGQGAVGSDILFRNLGSFPFVVEDFSGDQSVIINPGQARYFYLVSNATTDGIWHNFAFGVGTSSADAASLVGAGLTNVAGKLATTNSIIEVSAAFTLSDTSRALTYVWTGGLDSITLPSVSSLSAGWYFMLRNSGSGSLTVNTSGVAQINGESSITLNPSDSAIVIVDKNGGDFYTVGLAPQTGVSFTAATYDVDSVIGNTLNLVSYAPTIQTYVALAGVRTQTLNVVLPAITQLYVLSNSTNNSTYNVTFQVSGSSQSPIQFSTGTVAVVLSDGANLYILTQVGQGYYFADNGIVTAPSYSFINDTSSGMYLPSVHQLALASNGANVMLFNASNPADVQVSTTAQFNARIISGGTF
jgi:hypothetical protein